MDTAPFLDEQLLLRMETINPCFIPFYGTPCVHMPKRQNDPHEPFNAGSSCSYYLGFELHSSKCIALALRHAILPKNIPDWPMCEIPAMLRHDHGKDMLSKHIQQVMVELKIVDFKN